VNPIPSAIIDAAEPRRHVRNEVKISSVVVGFAGSACN
jgi:hypothetical protein